MTTMTITDGRARRAKLPGTGQLDTSPDAWEALFRDFLSARDSLASVMRRDGHGIRYGAAVERARKECWSEYRAALEADRAEPPLPGARRLDARWRLAAAKLRWLAQLRPGPRGSRAPQPIPPYLAQAVAEAPLPVCRCGGAIAEERAHYWSFCDACTARWESGAGYLELGAPTVDVRAPVVDLAEYRRARPGSR